ncbi:AMP-binding protein [Spartinivicinus poritis]|uniref:AMP-binding protein n=1 Tax=Spartinivicinus poritis TaxID=2994640 RepID=A0ABT5U1W3_9GAMM|nr:AMP-binding protein [Spartinivicinus sp. A2-2]MDE1460359.1 AMP-binding protein [Spartinivicinus sp. A2-2]
MLSRSTVGLIPDSAWQPACFNQIEKVNKVELYQQPVGYLADGQMVTTATLLNAVADYAEKLADSAGSEGWAIYCEDAIHFIIALLAALKTRLSIVIIPNKQPATFNDLIAQNYTLLTDVSLAGSNKHYISITFDELTHSQNVSDLNEELLFSVSRQQPLFFYTSGTTGEPKLIAKQFGQLIDEVAVLNGLWRENTAQAVFISTVSHQHIYGFLFKILWPLTTGSPIFSPLVSYPEELLAISCQFAKVVWIASPALLKRLPDAIDGPVESLAMMVSSGGKLEYHIARQVADKLQQLPVEVLGSTETGGVAWRQQYQENSAWTPLPRCTVSKDVETGCLQVSSPFISSDHSHFVMGDIIELQKDGQFYLKERADRIVKIEEKRLSLTQLEAVLQQCKEVSQVAAVGLLTGARAKVGVAIVLTTAGQEMLHKLGKRSLNLHFTQRLSNHFERTLLPKKWRYVNQLPENSQGKVSVSALAALFEKK